MKIFLCGDVMLGRGIDQILPHPSSPEIHEPFVRDARDYVRFAQNSSGKINHPVTFDYVWGDALKELEKEKVDLRIINLETTITTSQNFEPKGINYRMNPQNIDVLKIFRVNVACLANNHILDFGPGGLRETVEVLNKNGILTVGAGKNIKEATKPAAIKNGNRVLIFNYADVSSGVPVSWKAGKDKPGVNLVTLPISHFAAPVSDLVIFSIHWGPNWGYEIRKEERNFARQLIEEANVDIVFGHSSHHFRGIETYKGKIIIYGAGDFINDYEGIKGEEEFRGDLVLGYVIKTKAKKIANLILLPFRIKNFKLNHCTPNELNWIFKVLKRESKIDGNFKEEGGRIILNL
jgi:poly-gamma-glutamate capsule biosynthesis protein CapA/YwtB (metallophosphatase superfamily)